MSMATVLLCAVWVVFGVIASWALVVSVAWLAIALYAPDDEPDEVDEKVGKEQK